MASARLAVNLLGRFQVTTDGQEVTGFDSDKVRALLAYLIVEANRPIRRERLAGLLWPEQSERAARTNLRRALSNLRQVIQDHTADPPFLHVSRQTLQFNLASDYWLDVQAFSLSAGASSAEVEQLEEAVSLYQGQFLEGFSLADSVAFEEWQLLTREGLGRQLLGALERLASQYEHLGLYARALPHAYRQIELDPFDETGRSQLVRLLALSGRRSEALAQYEAYRQLLSEELGVVPDQKITLLHDQIRSSHLGRDFIEPSVSFVRGYELRERLGSGSFGVVYRAYQPTIKRDVAIKIIRPEFANQPEFIRRFDAEAQLAARLEHPHIVPLYDYWREPDGAFLIMRWLKGGNLQKSLAQGPWSVEAAANLADELASALHIAHSRGVIHRDVKPVNILLDEEGHTYLSDFGIATLAEKIQLPGLSSLRDGGSQITLSPEYVSPEQVRGGLVTTLADIYSLGMVLFVVLTGKHPYDESPLEEMPTKHLLEPLPAVRSIRPDLPAAVDEVIQKATAKEPEARYADVLTLAEDFREALTTKTAGPLLSAIAPRIDLANPYKGLRPFQEADCEEFFGRQELTQQLLDHLSLENDRFLALVGPSGSGKSSVVKAGLVPALRRGAVPGSEKWFISEMVPGRHPFEELEAALSRIAINSPVDFWQTMLAGDGGLLRAVHQALPEPESQLLLIIDQFEELFSLTEEKIKRELFLDGLCSAVMDPQNRFRLVLTLRADFYDRPLQYPGFAQLIRQNTEIVLPLSKEELRQAIAGPADQIRLGLEPGLATAIIEDVYKEPGALPLLQYALTELFEHRQGNELTLEAYRSIGRVAGAIAQRAEELYANLDEMGREVVRQLFLHLIIPGENAVHARRRIPRSELLSLHFAGLNDSSEFINKTIEFFGRYRLLTFDHDQITRIPTVEIAHEALLGEWDRLKGWIESSKEDLRWHQRLTEAAEEWLDSDKDASFLLQGTRLEMFVDWSNTTDLALTPMETEFLAASLAEQQALQAMEERRLARERSLEKGRRNLRIALALSSIVVIIGIVIGGIIIGSDIVSGVERGITSAFGLVDLSPAAQETRVASLARHKVYSIPQGKGMAFRPTGGELAISGLDNTATIREAATGTVLSYLHGHNDFINNIVYSLDGQRLATTSMDGTAKVWDAESGEELLTVRGAEGDLVSPALSPDGTLLAATSFNGEWRRLTARIWDVSTGEELYVLGFGEHIGGLAFSPDGTQLAIPGTVGKVTIWDVSSGKQQFSLREHDEPVTDVAFSPDGQRLLTVSMDGTARVWDLSSREPISTMRGHNGGVLGGDFSPDGQLVATGGMDSLVKVWDAESGRELQRFYGHEEMVTNVAFSPDGRFLASGGEDNTTIIWFLPD